MSGVEIKAPGLTDAEIERVCRRLWTVEQLLARGWPMAEFCKPGRDVASVLVLVEMVEACGVELPRIRAALSSLEVLS